MIIQKESGLLGLTLRGYGTTNVSWGDDKSQEIDSFFHIILKIKSNETKIIRYLQSSWRGNPT